MRKYIDMEESEDKYIPPIINLVNINDFSGLKNLLILGASKVDEVDSSGMTALHHAAYKGQTDICQLLLEYGADINIDSHDHQYSTLHFGALAGKLETIKLLLAFGAKTGTVNSLKRTAAQMAGFVGNYDISATINGYVSESVIKQYATSVSSSEIPTELVKPLHNFVLQANLHPVHLALTAMKCEKFLSNMHLCLKVLESLRDKECKKSENINEALCLKFHYLAYTLETLHTAYQKNASKTENEDSMALQAVIKKWLKPRAEDGYEEQLELFVRSAIKAFPYVEMPLFYPLVRNITTEGTNSWALGSLHNAINGQRGFPDENACVACSASLPQPKKCSRCKTAQYCDSICQKLHWSAHKKFCQAV